MPASSKLFWTRWTSAVWAWTRPLAVAGQVAQLADWGWGNEAAPQQPVLQQLRQPGGISHIGLAPGHDLDVAGVD
jgi:hypothetical protein